MSKDHKMLTETVPAIALSTAVLAPVEDLNIKEQLEAWIALDTIEKTIAKRKEALRDVLLGHVQTNGVTNDKGHQEVVLDDTKVIREKRVGKLPEMAGLEALCKKMKVAKEKLPFDIVETKVINPSKLESLVELGKLTEDDLKPLHKVTYALQVEQSQELQQLIKVLKEGGVIEVEEVVAPVEAQAQAG